MSSADALTCLTFSPDSRKVAYGTARSGVTITHIDSKNKGVKTFAVVDTPVIIAWSPDGENIMTASLDNKLRCWSAISLDAIGPPFEGHKGTILTASFLPGPSQAMSLSRDGQMFIWDIRSGRVTRRETVSKNAQTIFVTALSIDGTLLVTGDEKKGIAWEIPECVRRADISLPSIPLLQAAIIPNRLRQVVLVFGDMSFGIWDTRARTFSRVHFQGLGGNAIPLATAVSPDGELLALELDGVGDDQPTRFYDRKGKEFANPNIRCIHPFAFSPDGKSFAASSVSSGSKDGSYKLVVIAVKEILGRALDVSATVTSVDKGKQRALSQNFFEEPPRASSSAGGRTFKNGKEGPAPPQREAHQQASQRPAGPKRRMFGFLRNRPSRETGSDGREAQLEATSRHDSRERRNPVSRIRKRTRHPESHEVRSPETVVVPPAQAINRLAVSRSRKATKGGSNKSSSSARQQGDPHNQERQNVNGRSRSRNHDAGSIESEIVHPGGNNQSIRAHGCWKSFWTWLCF